ncbi:50S ribosomal protein L5 [Candidatus Solincola tengchongensis]|uniref:50S ribosomal protein L5 n=1 Tax=Candidatus Solincola tengchongensis TaxID=2900693 RepID=UPI0025805939|nr:50S ribosomal protein L5 [Candidatus Solincola tengchongensis]
MAPRLKEKYLKEVVPALKQRFGYRNDMEVPRLEKIVVNMGVGEGAHDPKAIDGAMKDLALITGQKPKLNRAKKSVAGFKLRAGMSVGCKVTLRGDRMYEFLDRLMSLAIPRVRDFRGLNPKSFDGRGNFTMGLDEQLVFPEIDYDDIDRVRGMDITIVTTAKTDEEGRALLDALGMPFRGK